MTVTPAFTAEMSEPSANGAAADLRNRITPPAGIRKMLQLPEAGNRVARRWAIASVIVYLIVGGLLVFTVTGHESIAEFLGLGATKNFTVFVLISSGIVASVAAILAVFRDIRHMATEESDVDWLTRTGRDGLRWVFVDSAQRNRALAHGWTDFPDAGANPIQTLTDDRVRRLERVHRDEDGARISPVELRAIAEKRTSRYGELARYMSSMLLLLAVLGTFAGVKSALPGLIDALTSSANSASMNNLIRPLTAVEDAFGGNALALVGALALGIAAQGLAFGRRNLLERLELVSVEYIYGRETLAGADPMQAAANSLEETARDLHSLGATMTGVESGLQQLGDDFRGALSHLTDELRDLTDQQHSALYTQTGQTLDALQRRVGEMASAVEGNAHTSARLIDSVQLRADDARAAIEELRHNHEQMAQALHALGATATNAQRMFEQADQRFGLMGTAADRLGAASESLSLHVTELHQVVAEVGSVTDRTAESFTAALGSKVSDLRDTVEAVSATNGRTAEAMSAVLSQVREGTDRTCNLLTELRDAARTPGDVSTGGARSGSDSAPVLQELRTIARKLESLDALRSENRMMRWTIPGVLTVCTAIIVAAMEYISHAR